MTATAELNAPLTIGARARLLLPARRAFSFARPLPSCLRVPRSPLARTADEQSYLRVDDDGEGAV